MRDLRSCQGFPGMQRHSVGPLNDTLGLFLGIMAITAVLGISILFPSSLLCLKTAKQLGSTHQDPRMVDGAVSQNGLWDLQSRHILGEISAVFDVLGLLTVLSEAFRNPPGLGHWESSWSTRMYQWSTYLRLSKVCQTDVSKDLEDYLPQTWQSKEPHM